MKLITPPMASEPYSAEAPSFSTSTRSMAPAWMLLRSTPASSPGEAKLARRRPLSRISVLDTPTPRRLAPLKPRWPEVPSVMLAPSVSGALLAVSVRTSSAAVVTPRSRMSSRVMISIGSAVSPSRRLMREPVTNTVSSSVFATSASAAPTPAGSHRTCARASASSERRGVEGHRLIVLFMVTPAIRAGSAAPCGYREHRLTGVPRTLQRARAWRGNDVAPGQVDVAIAKAGGPRLRHGRQ